MRAIALVLFGMAVGHVQDLVGETHPFLDKSTTSSEDILGISIVAQPIKASWDGEKRLTVIQTDKYGRVHLSQESIKQIAKEVWLSDMKMGEMVTLSINGPPHHFQKEYDRKTVGFDDLEDWLRERREQ